MTDLLRQEIAATADMLVVKVGTRVLTGPQGRLDPGRIEQLADQIHHVIASGRKVALVSSGAVGSGMGRLGLKSRPTDLARLQAVAAVGQSVLVEAYERALERYGYHAAQILLTADDLSHRTRYLNARNTILTLFDLGAVPIINENDTVAVEELQTTFGDNDHLAAVVTNLIQAPLLVLLSDVEGLYDGNPREPQSRLVPTVARIDAEIRAMVRDTSGQLSKGGMASKLNAARLATSAGQSVIITSGETPDVLKRILAGEPVGTLFLARNVRPRGHLVLDPGARRAVECEGRSLLPIGIVDVVGRFTKADIVALRDQEGVEFARGLTNYTADEVRKIKGLKTSDITAALGYCPYQEVIHRDNMVVTS
jgi:glutamate 5-kinase